MYTRTLGQEPLLIVLGHGPLKGNTRFELKETLLGRCEEGNSRKSRQRANEQRAGGRAWGRGREHEWQPT